MEKKTLIPAAALIAAAIVIFGLLMNCAMNNFVNKDRKVTVKGLSEIEVPADKVTWPIVTVETGNDMQGVYKASDATTKKIMAFLTSNGISSDEMIFGTPQVTDMNANRYGNEYIPYKYRLRSVLTVMSSDVEKVRGLISRQGELLDDGIAVINDGYSNQISFDLSSFSEIKPQMMEEAIANARKTAEQLADNSGSRLGKILNASQGQFSLSPLDENTPHIIKLRVVTTITYSLKD